MGIICARISVERSILMRIFIDHWTWCCFALYSKIRINLTNELWMTADQNSMRLLGDSVSFCSFSIAYLSEVGKFQIESYSIRKCYVDYMKFKQIHRNSRMLHGIRPSLCWTNLFRISVFIIRASWFSLLAIEMRLKKIFFCRRKRELDTKKKSKPKKSKRKTWKSMTLTVSSGSESF